MNYSQLKTVTDTIAFHGQESRHKPAIICDGVEYNYEQLDRESNRTAHAILSSGVKAGARIAHLGKESVHYYDLFFACAKSSTVLVPINWRLTASEIEYILKDSGAQLLLVEAQFLPQLESLLNQLPSSVKVVNMGADGPDELHDGFLKWKQHCTDNPVSMPVDENTPLIQLYTSGTTGFPKGVVIAHRSFFKIRNLIAEANLDWVDWKPDDVSLIGIPGFHVAGIWWAMQAFNAGVVNISMRTFSSDQAVALVRKYGVTTTLVVPSMLYMMISESREPEIDFKSFRKIAYGGSPITETLLQKSMDTFQCEFLQMYGLTETGNVAICLPPEEHVANSKKIRAAGVPIPGVELKIVDENDKQLNVGEIGEVCVKTPAVMLQYWGLDEATEAALAGGWLHTGDAGYQDEDGYLFITDRIKDMIIVAGENVYPAEVENALTLYEGVEEAAVIGLPDKRWGQAVHAFLVVNAQTEVVPRKLSLFLRQHIAAFKIPTQFHFIDEIPRNASGKILRRVLRDTHSTNHQEVEMEV